MSGFFSLQNYHILIRHKKTNDEGKITIDEIKNWANT